MNKSILQLVVQLEKGGAQEVAQFLQATFVNGNHKVRTRFFYDKYPFHKNLSSRDCYMSKKSYNPTKLARLLFELRIDVRSYEVVLCHTPVALILCSISTLFNRRINPHIIYLQHGRDELLSKHVLYLYRITIKVKKKITKVSVFPSLESDFLWIPNPVPSEHATEHKVSGKLKLLVVARHSKEKNTLFIAKNTPNDGTCKLTFVGSGPLLRYVRNVAESRFESGDVEFYEKLSKKEVLDLMHKCDVLVSASTTEGMPLVCLEAISTGLPMLLSDIEGHRMFAPRKIARFFSLNNSQDYQRSIMEIKENHDLFYSFADFINYKQENREEDIAEKWKRLVRDLC